MLPSRDEIVQAYRKYCELVADADDTIDLSHERFFYPTTLLPLGIYVQRNAKKVVKPTNPDVSNYVSLITGHRREGFLYSDSYMPIVCVPKAPYAFDPIFSAIIGICDQGRKFGGVKAFEYYLAELSQNIYDHSEFQNAYIMVQRYEKKGFVEIVLIDDGISIPGSYERHGVTAADDNEHLKNAMNGASTKLEGSRGCGLGTSIKLLTKMDGQFFLVSRRGALYADAREQTFFKLAAQEIYNGTLITIRVPYPARELSNEAFYHAIEG